MSASLKARQLFTLISLALTGSATSFAGLDCPKDFGKIKTVKEETYRLSNAEKDEIRAFCQKQYNLTSDTREAAFNRLAAKKSPEFLFYLMLECSGKPGDVSYSFRNALVRRLNSGDSALLNASAWEKLGKANASFEGVPAAMKARWRATALSDLRKAKRAAENEQFDKAAATALMILHTKLAMPYMSPEALKNAVRTAATAYSRYITTDLIPGIYPPEAFQFAKEMIKRELGLEYIPLTDLVVVKQGNEVEFKIISIDKPKVGRKSIANDGAFHTYSVENLKVNSRVNSGKEIANGSVEWKVGDKEYEAKYSATVGEKIADIAPELPKLDYAGLWKDKKLTGMIFPGANMGAGDAGAHDVMNYYKQYYRDHGFRFAAPKHISDMEKFMEEEVSSGRLDYVIKEAHSDGTDTSLVKVIKDGNIATGTKTLPGGKEEVVHIFYPNRPQLARGEDGDDILYASVGDWMKKRAEKGGKQVFFLDTACFGIDTVCKLVNSVQNKNLVVGGSDETLETFTNEEGSGISKILDGLRNHKTFQEMKASGKDEEGEAWDKYVLPGMAKWKKSIHGEMARSVETKVEVFQNGKKVDIETLGDQ